MAAPTPRHYLSVDDVWAINIAVCAREGISAHLRDGDGLAGALTRPETAAHYEQSDEILQAAILIVSIALAHAFIDGDKRTAAIAGASSSISMAT